MFEKEAEEYGLQQALWCTSESGDLRDAFKDGAQFGYNKAKEDADKMKSQFLELCNLKDMRIEKLEKANEWHYVSKEGDLPKEDLRPRTLGYYLTASKHKSYKGFVFEVAYFTGVIFTKGGDILDNVIAWKEIVLPEESD